MPPSLPRGVLFRLPPDVPRHAHLYYHCELALAEGLRELGVPVYGDRDYWRPAPDAPFTIPAAPADFTPDVHIHSCFNIVYHPHRRAALDLPGRHVVVDADDGESLWLSSPISRAAHLVLRAHYRADLGHLPHVRPWAFGLTNRIISTLTNWPATPPAPGLSWNFRHDHNLRRLIRRRLSPALLARHPLIDRTESLTPPPDDFLQKQTFGRHSLPYFQGLHAHRLAAAFGGNFHPPGSRSSALPFRVLRRLRNGTLALRKRLAGVRDYEGFLDFFENHPHLYQVQQFDSWRWWESLLSASVPLHLDFADHGWVLPVMPENGVHYLGLRGWDHDAFSARILALDDPALDTIARQGKDWALKHYSPRASALRLLSYLDNL